MSEKEEDIADSKTENMDEADGPELGEEEGMNIDKNSGEEAKEQDRHQRKNGKKHRHHPNKEVDLTPKDPKEFIDLKHLKQQKPDDLQASAEKYWVENPGSMLKQDIIFSILK